MRKRNAEADAIKRGLDDPDSPFTVGLSIGADF